uniref:Uncharacterized protein n=1 Tax=Arundo donax TaxID=35708 RepID=A0A0A9H387_ARUDO
MWPACSSTVDSCRTCLVGYRAETRK